MLCVDLGGAFAVGGVAAGGCNNDFSYWQVGSRTEWAPVSNLIIGLDILYSKLNTASEGAAAAAGGVALSAGNATPTTTNIADQDVWSAFFRVQRSFYP